LQGGAGIARGGADGILAEAARLGGGGVNDLGPRLSLGPHCLAGSACSAVGRAARPPLFGWLAAHPTGSNSGALQRGGTAKKVRSQAQPGTESWSGAATCVRRALRR